MNNHLKREEQKIAYFREQRRNKFGNCFWRSINCINSFFPPFAVVFLAAIYFTSFVKRNYCVVVVRQMTRGRSINFIFSLIFSLFFCMVSRWIIESYFCSFHTTRDFLSNFWIFQKKKWFDDAEYCNSHKKKIHSKITQLKTYNFCQKIPQKRQWRVVTTDKVTRIFFFYLQSVCCEDQMKMKNQSEWERGEKCIRESFESERVKIA